MRKREFRPDKPKATVFSKLYPTKKQRLALVKWLLYALVLLVVSVVQDVILSRFRLFGATTDLVPCAIMLICIVEGSENACVFTLLASTAFLLSGSAPGSYCIIFICFLALAAAVFRQSFLRKGFNAAMVCLAAVTVGYEMLVFLTGLFLGNTKASRAGVFLLSGLYSLIAAPALYPIALAIGKIGGEPWKE